VGFTISTGIQSINTHSRSFQRSNCPNRFTCQFSYLVAPLPLGEDLGEGSTLYGVATFR
jgi:hypothetical protein